MVNVTQDRLRQTPGECHRCSQKGRFGKGTGMISGMANVARRRVGIAALAFGLLVGGSWAGTALAQHAVSGVEPAAASAGLRPGLAVLYYSGDFKHIDAMPDLASAKKLGRPGQPLPNLNFRSNTGGMLESQSTQMWGLDADGFIHLDKPGTYTFVAKSNDGVRVFIGDKMLLDDPDVHRDRFSMPGTIEVKTPGWYPIKVRYFQRKVTCALELHWQPPGAGNMSVVPPAAFSHLANGEKMPKPAN